MVRTAKQHNPPTQSVRTKQAVVFQHSINIPSYQMPSQSSLHQPNSAAILFLNTIFPNKSQQYRVQGIDFQLVESSVAVEK